MTTKSDKPEADPQWVCPLCGDNNLCAMAGSEQSAAGCWCMDMNIDREVLKRIPEGKIGQACLCRRCASIVPAK